MKSNPSTGIFVEVLLDAGAVKFTAELEVVASDFPGKTVDQLIVGIDAASRIARSRAGLREETRAAAGRRRQKNDRQARGVARRRPDGNIAESDGIGIKILVLWKKSFGKAVPAVTQLVQFC